VHPSNEAITLIRDYVTDWSLDDAAIAAALNTATLANPIPAATVAKPFSVRDMMSSLDAAALGKIYNLPSLPRLLDDIEAGDLVRLENWLALLQAGGTLTAAQAATLSGMIHATMPDPSWSAQISWAVANVGRAVDFQDVADARLASGGSG
jgi:hypothetical protein